MQSIDWRNPAAYKRIKDLPPAGFAWEYLRRNEDYRHDVERLAQRREPTGEEADAFASRWGYDFAHDPDAQPDGELPFWSPHFNPQAIILSPVERNDPDGERLFALAHLDGLILRRAPDGWHAIWRVDGVEHQFWIPQGAINAAVFYAATLPMDEFMELRVHAARRLWRCLTGRSPGREIHTMPEQLRQWHLLTLRALDARLHGESYRAVAEVLLGFRGNKEDFETDPRKNKARRLVAHGIRMMRGGYRLLLHYPVKRGSRSKSK